jgi:hypothetical protein
VAGGMSENGSSVAPETLLTLPMVRSRPWTALFNRWGWTRLLAAEESRCRRYGHPAGVIVVDHDDLKSISDSLGHFAGEELLSRAAAAITEVKREQELVARVGWFAPHSAPQCESRPKGSSRLGRRLTRTCVQKRSDRVASAAEAATLIGLRVVNRAHGDRAESCVRGGMAGGE